MPNHLTINSSDALLWLRLLPSYTAVIVTPAAQRGVSHVK